MLMLEGERIFLMMDYFLSFEDLVAIIFTLSVLK